MSYVPDQLDNLNNIPRLYRSLYVTTSLYHILHMASEGCQSERNSITTVLYILKIWLIIIHNIDYIFRTLILYNYSSLI
jgi:hypothetical protein